MSGDLSSGTTETSRVEERDTTDPASTSHGDRDRMMDRGQSEDTGTLPGGNRTELEDGGNLSSGEVSQSCDEATQSVETETDGDETETETAGETGRNALGSRKGYYTLAEVLAESESEEWYGNDVDGTDRMQSTTNDEQPPAADEKDGGAEDEEIEEDDEDEEPLGHITTELRAIRADRFVDTEPLRKFEEQAGTAEDTNDKLIAGLIEHMFFNRLAESYNPEKRAMSTQLLISNLRELVRAFDVDWGRMTPRQAFTTVLHNLVAARVMHTTYNKKTETMSISTSLGVAELYKDTSYDTIVGIFNSALSKLNAMRERTVASVNWVEKSGNGYKIYLCGVYPNAGTRIYNHAEATEEDRGEKRATMGDVADSLRQLLNSVTRSTRAMKNKRVMQTQRFNLLLSLYNDRVIDTGKTYDERRDEDYVAFIRALPYTIHVGAPWSTVERDVAELIASIPEPGEYWGVDEFERGRILSHIITYTHNPKTLAAQKILARLVNNSVRHKVAATMRYDYIGRLMRTTRIYTAIADLYSSKIAKVSGDVRKRLSSYLEQASANTQAARYELVALGHDVGDGSGFPREILDVNRNSTIDSYKANVNEAFDTAFIEFLYGPDFTESERMHILFAPGSSGANLMGYIIANGNVNLLTTLTNRYAEESAEIDASGVGGRLMDMIVGASEMSVNQPNEIEMDWMRALAVSANLVRLHPIAYVDDAQPAIGNRTSETSMYTFFAPLAAILSSCSMMTDMVTETIRYLGATMTRMTIVDFAKMMTKSMNCVRQVIFHDEATFDQRFMNKVGLITISSIDAYRHPKKIETAPIAIDVAEFTPNEQSAKNGTRGRGEVEDAQSLIRNSMVFRGKMKSTMYVPKSVQKHVGDVMRREVGAIVESANIDDKKLPFLMDDGTFHVFRQKLVTVDAGINSDTVWQKSGDKPEHVTTHPYAVDLIPIVHAMAFGHVEMARIILLLMTSRVLYDTEKQEWYSIVDTTGEKRSQRVMENTPLGAFLRSILFTNFMTRRHILHETGTMKVVEKNFGVRIMDVDKPTRTVVGFESTNLLDMMSRFRHHECMRLLADTDAFGYMAAVFRRVVKLNRRTILGAAWLYYGDDIDKAKEFTRTVVDIVTSDDIKGNIRIPAIHYLKLNLPEESPEEEAVAEVAKEEKPAAPTRETTARADRNVAQRRPQARPRARARARGWNESTPQPRARPRAQTRQQRPARNTRDSRVIQSRADMSRRARPRARSRAVDSKRVTSRAPQPRN